MRGFDGAEFYGVFGDFEQNKERREKETDLALGDRESIIDTYGNDT